MRTLEIKSSIFRILTPHKKQRGVEREGLYSRTWAGQGLARLGPRTQPWVQHTFLESVKELRGWEARCLRKLLDHPLKQNHWSKVSNGSFPG